MPPFLDRPKYWLSHMTCSRDADCLAAIAIVRTLSKADFAYLKAPFSSKLEVCDAIISSVERTLTGKMESCIVCMHFGYCEAKL